MGLIKMNPIQYITSESGEKISVILPFGEYERMIEDLHDFAVIAERKDEDTFSLSEIKKLLHNLCPDKMRLNSAIV